MDFSLLVKPASADCNLRCKYCFYLDHIGFYNDQNKTRMSEDTLEAMISSFMRQKMRGYTFGWQGGEPTLMGQGFFEKAVALQQKYGANGAQVSNGLQTNCTMIDQNFAEFLAKYNFLVGVSVDGPAEIHDANRISIGGQGTHATVMSGIDHLSKAGVDFNTLTLVNSLNAKDGSLIYRYLRDSGFLFQQYIPCVEFDNKGGLLPFSVGSEQWGEFMCAVFDEWIKGDTRTVSVRLFDTLIQYYMDGTRNSCSIATDCRQYFVVEYTGDIYPCDFYVEKDLCLGNVADDPWNAALESKVYRDFGARKRAINAECDACPYLEVCMGDCPKNRSHDGMSPTQVSALCAGWKLFYAHTLPTFKKIAHDLNIERQQERNVKTAVNTKRNSVKPNAICPCGSGLKYKKCCGR